MLQRAGVLVLAVLALFALFSLWEQSRTNGERLREALTELDAARADNRRLTIIAREQSGQLDTNSRTLDRQAEGLTELRRALIEVGLSPAEVDRLAEGGAGGSTSGGTPGAGGSTSTPSTPSAPGSGRPPPAQPNPPAGGSDPPGGGSSTPPSSTPPPEPPPEPPPAQPEPEPRCRVADPLTGDCAVRLDTPLDPILDGLTGT